jgi:hypothetical protein
MRLAALAAIAHALAVAANIADASAAGFRRGAILVVFFNFAATTGEGPSRRYYAACALISTVPRTLRTSMCKVATSWSSARRPASPGPWISTT